MSGIDLRAYSPPLFEDGLEDSTTPIKRKLSPGIESESKKVNNAVETVGLPKTAAARVGIILIPEPGIDQRYLHPFQSGNQTIFLKSQKDVQILEGKQEGKTIKQIADELGLGTKAIYYRLSQLKKTWKGIDQIGKRALSGKAPDSKTGNNAVEAGAFSSLLSKRDNPEPKFYFEFKGELLPLKDEIEFQILKGLEAGKKVKEIADELGCSKGAIYYRWNQLKETRPNLEQLSNSNFHHFTPEQKNAIVSGVRDRKSFEEIADELGIEKKKVKSQWYQVLQPKYPDITYDPINRLHARSSREKNITGRAQNPEVFQFGNQVIEATTEQEKLILAEVRKGKSFSSIAYSSHIEIDAVVQNWERMENRWPILKNFRPDSYRIFSVAEKIAIVLGIKNRKSYKQLEKELGIPYKKIKGQWEQVLQAKYPHIKYNPIQNRKKQETSAPDPVGSKNEEQGSVAEIPFPIAPSLRDTGENPIPNEVPFEIPEEILPTFNDSFFSDAADLLELDASWILDGTDL